MIINKVSISPNVYFCYLIYCNITIYILYEECTNVVTVDKA